MKNSKKSLVVILLFCVLLAAGVLALKNFRKIHRVGKQNNTSSVLSATSTSAILNKDSIAKALAYTVSRHGLSFLILENGKIVFEDYHNGYEASDSHVLASGSKSFSGIILAALIQDGYVSSFDEKVSNTITEWKNDPSKKDITIRQLLSLSSGLDPGDNGKAPSFSDAINAQVSAPVGTFQYGPVPFQVFGELTKRKLNGKDPVVYLKERVLDPIGVTLAGWRNVSPGSPNMPGGAKMQAREWAEFGEFLRNKGLFQGKQIIRPELIDELTTLQTKNTPEQYGITFWLGQASEATEAGTKYSNSLPGESTSQNSEALPKFFMAAGAGKQRLYVIRSLGLVIVLQSDSGPQDKFSDVEFLQTLLK
ncbi:MAG: serine hydrolase [Patescibacteria group bacterium]